MQEVQLCFTPLSKFMSTLRMIAYATSADALDENLRMLIRTERESVHKFCKYVIKLYSPRYLCKPSYNDIQQLYGHHANAHTFLKCLEDWIASIENGEISRVHIKVNTLVVIMDVQ